MPIVYCDLTIDKSKYHYSAIENISCQGMF